MIRKIGLYHLFPLFIAALVIFFIYFFIPTSSPTIKSETHIHKELIPNGHFSNFDDGLNSEMALMSSLNNPYQVTLFGSSELSSISNIFPYNFLKDSLSLNCLAFGHAHHQNLSILSELMAARPFIKNAQVVILLSPGWFEGGTNPESFLEFVRPNFLRRIIHDSLIDEKYKLHIGKYIYDHCSYFEGMTKEQTYLQDLYLSKKGNYISQLITQAKTHIRSVHANKYYVPSVKYIPSNYAKTERKIWSRDIDSLLKVEQTKFLQSVKNDLFVDQTYYETYLLEDDGSQKIGEVADVNYLKSDEMNDFKLLLTFLKENQVNASFVILPLNPYYYENVIIQKPLIDELSHSINNHQFPLLDLSCFDKNSYKKGVLRDVMHPGEYGWILINEFISKTYP